MANVFQIRLSVKWDRISNRLSRWGIHPSGMDLANALRECPKIPPDMVEYVAGRLEGSVKVPRGSTPKSEVERWTRPLIVTMRVRYRQAVYRRIKFSGKPRPANLPHLLKIPSGWKVKAPRDRAIERVARREGLSPAHVRDIVKSISTAPGWVQGRLPTLQELHAHLDSRTKQ